MSRICAFNSPNMASTVSRTLDLVGIAEAAVAGPLGKKLVQLRCVRHRNCRSCSAPGQRERAADGIHLARAERLGHAVVGDSRDLFHRGLGPRLGRAGRPVRRPHLEVGVGPLLPVLDLVFWAWVMLTAAAEVERL